MSGKVYLKRKLDITLNQEESTIGKVLKFKTKFNPLAAEVVPTSKLRKSEDSELASHLKHLLKNNENGLFGNVEITGEIQFSENTAERPSETDTELSTCHLDLSLKGNFPWFINTLQNEGSFASFEVQLENVLAVTGQKFAVATFSELQKSFCAEKNLFTESMYLSYSDQAVEFTLNAETWDFLFRPKMRGMSCPKLSLAVCANISERMAKNLHILSPNGLCYALTPFQSKVQKERLQESSGGAQPDTLIVGQSGKQWQVQSKYLIDGSPVFQTVLEKPNFDDDCTKRVHLDNLDDKTLDCLLEYINWFNMEKCLNDFGLAVRMLEIADRFQIYGLTKALEEMLMRRSNINPAQAIRLFSYVRYVEHFHLLKRKALLILRQNRNEWTNSEDYKTLFRKNPELAWDLLTSAFQNDTSDLSEVQNMEKSESLFKFQCPNIST